jgi:uncharacterized protein (DUF1501 family)
MTLNRCSGPISRREFLTVGSLALGGLGLADVLRGRAAGGESHRDTSVIMLYLNGGPSQLETYDLKPDAPMEYRSVFAPIQTSVPGLDICELFPLQARIADKFSLVRSLNHDVGIHSDGGIVVLTGKRPSQLDPTSQSKSEHPDVGSVTSKIRGTEKHLVPQYVSIPRKPYMTRPTYLGLHHASFETGDPSKDGFRPPGFALTAGRDGKGLDDRKSLLDQLDRYRRVADESEQLNVTDKFRSLAFEMLTSPETAVAFDLSREDESLRDRYGRHLWGQGCLLARRLAEAGAAVINVDINTPKSGEKFTNWDDHIANAGRPGHFAEYMKVRLPYMDQALSALIEDVFERGLDRRVLIVVMGEFGRTPRLSRNSTGVGRDHWPQAYSALVSGGGFRMGQVIGATNAKAEYPTVRPYSPQDLLATIYHHLGIDPNRQFVDFMGRPVAILPHGNPIRELL